MTLGSYTAANSCRRRETTTNTDKPEQKWREPQTPTKGEMGCKERATQHTMEFLHAKILRICPLQKSTCLCLSLSLSVCSQLQANLHQRVCVQHIDRCLSYRRPPRRGGPVEVPTPGNTIREGFLHWEKASDDSSECSLATGCAMRNGELPQPLVRRPSDRVSWNTSSCVTGHQRRLPWSSQWT